MDLHINHNRSEFLSLTAALCRWVRETPLAPAITWLESGSATDHSYRMLFQRALAIAGEIEINSNPGDPVLLGFEQGVDYVAGFLACVFSGRVAVTSAPPHELRRSARLAALLDDSGSRVILTHDVAIKKFEDVAARVRLVNADRITAQPRATPCPVDPDGLMFIQYTSGSTSAPKGVMLTHGSIAANLRAIIADTRPDEQSMYISWLPLYHDMGLIFMTLAPLFAGRRICMMSPDEFLRHPIRWLEAISQYRGTITAAPSFAYRLCVERTKERACARVDLSSMRMFINGSEPISVPDMESFRDRFLASGLRPDALAGGYGMAELGVYACLGPMLSGDTWFESTALETRGQAVSLRLDESTAFDRTTARRLAACGSANPDHFDLRIVDPDTWQECSTGNVGEIWIAGDSVGKGYWRNSEATSGTFNHRIAGRDGVYMRTGDQGFIHDGQVYICGRLKELMIFRGRNVFPADICATVENCGSAMRGRRAAAFSIPGDQGEELVIVCAARVSGNDAAEAYARDIIAAVSLECGVIPFDIVFVPNRVLSRTTSGKVQHSAIRRDYLNGTLKAEFSLRGQEVAAAAEVRPADIPGFAPDWLVQCVCDQFAQVAELETVAGDADLFQLGLDSLRGLRLIETIETVLLGRGSGLSLGDIADLRTPRRIAAAITAKIAPESELTEVVL